MYILLMGVLNVLRGSEVPFTNKLITSVLCGILTYMLAGSYVIGLVTWLGIWLWSVLGWGKYYSAFTGEYNYKEKEFILADKVTDYLYLKRIWSDYSVGMIGMAIRGLLILPLFVALSLIVGNSLVVLYGVLCGFLQGLCYAAPRPFYGRIKRIIDNGGKTWNFAISLAELLMGLNIGFWLYMAIL